MILNKDKQRERLLEILSGAPTEILLNAVEDYKAFRMRQQEGMATVLRYFGDGEKKVEAPLAVPTCAQARAAVAETTVTSSADSLTFVKPPGTPTAKIGSDTEAAVIAWLRNGPANLSALAVAMSRNEKAAEGLLARLHDKGKIKYRSDKKYCLVE